MAIVTLRFGCAKQLKNLKRYLMPIHASMTLKCKIAVTTDTSFRGREVQPGVDPVRTNAAQLTPIKKFRLLSYNGKRQEV